MKKILLIVSLITISPASAMVRSRVARYAPDLIFTRQSNPLKEAWTQRLTRGRQRAEERWAQEEAAHSAKQAALQKALNLAQKEAAQQYSQRIQQIQQLDKIQRIQRAKQEAILRAELFPHTPLQNIPQSFRQKTQQKVLHKDRLDALKKTRVEKALQQIHRETLQQAQQKPKLTPLDSPTVQQNLTTIAREFAPEAQAAATKRTPWYQHIKRIPASRPTVEEFTMGAGLTAAPATFLTGMGTAAQNRNQMVAQAEEIARAKEALAAYEAAYRYVQAARAAEQTPAKARGYTERSLELIRGIPGESYVEAAPSQIYSSLGAAGKFTARQLRRIPGAHYIETAPGYVGSHLSGLGRGMYGQTIGRLHQ